MLVRIITGGTLAIYSTLAIVVGGPLLLWSVFALTIISAYELFLMLKNNNKKASMFFGLAAIFLGFISLAMFNLHPIVISWPCKIFILGLIVFYIVELFLKRLYFPNMKFLSTIRVIIFFLGTMSYIYLIRNTDNGLVNLLYASVLVWVSDTFSLFGGLKFGKTPLTSISPNKTFEGSLSGIGATLLFGLILSFLFHLPILFYLFLALVIALLAQIGDLHESLTKRIFNKKNSSDILPGHGGIYDRIDSCLFVMPVIFYLIT